MQGKSVRCILIVTFLALFVAVFISSHESELNFENLGKQKKKVPVKITIKKPTTNKSKVGKVSVKTQFTVSAKAGKSGAQVSAQGKTTATGTLGKATMSVDTDGKTGTSKTQKGKTTVTMDGKEKTGTSVTINGKTPIMSHGVIPSVKSSKSSFLSMISMSHSGILPSGSHKGAKDKKSGTSKDSGQKQELLPKWINGSRPLNQTNQTREVYYYPYPNELNYPEKTVSLGDGSLIFPNNTIVTQIELGQILVARAYDKKEVSQKEEMEKQRSYGITKYPQPNVYGFPEGTMMCGNGSILFSNGTELTALQFGQKAKSWTYLNGERISNATQQGFPEGTVKFPNETIKFPNGTFLNQTTQTMSFVKIPFPNDLGLPEGTKYFRDNESYVFANGTVVKSSSVQTKITPQKAAVPMQYFLVPNIYNFPNLTVLYSDGSVIFPNKTVLSKAEFKVMYDNTPVLAHMPNSFDFSKDTLIYQNGSLAIQSGKKLEFNETVAQKIRTEILVFSKAVQWPFPNEEGFPQGTRMLYNNSILFPNNTYFQDQGMRFIMRNPTAQKLQQDMSNPQDPSIQTQPATKPQLPTNSTMKLDVGVSGQGNQTTSKGQEDGTTSKNTTTIEGKGTVILNAKQNRRFIIL